jgi:hypothetical protein
MLGALGRAQLRDQKDGKYPWCGSSGAAGPKGAKHRPGLSTISAATKWMWRHALWSTSDARPAGDADRNRHAATLASPIDVGPRLLNLGHRFRRFPQHASYRAIFSCPE